MTITLNIEQITIISAIQFVTAILNVWYAMKSNETIIANSDEKDRSIDDILKMIQTPRILSYLTTIISLILLIGSFFVDISPVELEFLIISLSVFLIGYTVFKVKHDKDLATAYFMAFTNLKLFNKGVKLSNDILEKMK